LILRIEAYLQSRCEQGNPARLRALPAGNRQASVRTLSSPSSSANRLQQPRTRRTGQDPSSADWIRPPGPAPRPRNHAESVRTDDHPVLNYILPLSRVSSKFSHEIPCFQAFRSSWKSPPRRHFRPPVRLPVPHPDLTPRFAPPPRKPPGSRTDLRDPSIASEDPGLRSLPTAKPGLVSVILMI